MDNAPPRCGKKISGHPRAGCFSNFPRARISRNSSPYLCEQTPSPSTCPKPGIRATATPFKRTPENNLGDFPTPNDIDNSEGRKSSPYGGSMPRDQRASEKAHGEPKNIMKALTTLITALLLPLFAQANTPLPATGEGGTAQRGVREKGHASVLLAQADKLATKVTLDIPAGELTEALKALAKQTGTDLVFRPEQVEGHKTPGLKGEYTPKDAITKLLKGTPLRLSTNTAGAMLIAEPKPLATSLSRDDRRGEAINLAQDRKSVV